MIVQEYFKNREIACRCGCGKMPSGKSVEMLYAVRIIIKTPLVISSGARCFKHNETCRGSEYSTHLIGAFDIEVPREKEYEFIKIAQFVGFTGIGIKNNQFIHIDGLHESPEIWTY